MGIKLTGINKANVAKNLAKNYKYVPYVDKAIDQGEFNWEAKFGIKEEDDAFHPSGDCMPSVHDLWMKALGLAKERPFSTSLRKTFAVGHFWHAYLQYITVERLNFATWDQVEVRGQTGWGEMDMRMVPTFVGASTQFFYKPYHWATGSADVCPCELPGEGEFLIDYKTMNANDFRKPYAPTWAVDKWECQLNIYMDWFDQERSILVGVCKDNPHEMKEFEFRRNQELIDAIYTKWRLVSLCIDEDVEPPEDEIDEETGEVTPVVFMPLKGPVAT